jgi:hypothetical protein
MKNINVVSTRIVRCLTGITLACLFTLTLVPPAQCAENWRDPFEEICSKVDASSNMSIKELEALIERADKLAPEIQKSEDPAKKVYLRRLKGCRSMFEFAIDAKKSDGK